MNKLQTFIKITGLTVDQLAKDIGRGYHSVQKVVKGHRAVKYIRKDIAASLGLDFNKTWGLESDRYLSALIQKEIERKAKMEVKRLRARYLGCDDAVSKAA